MSAHYAIPATTLVIQTLIERALKAVYGAAATAPIVSIAPPPRSDPLRPDPSGRGETPSVLLFLYHVAPNAAWRNTYIDPEFDPDSYSPPLDYLPPRDRATPVDGQGQRVAKAPLALDLHYLIAATGDTLEREMVFGVALHAITRLGIIPRATIKQILAGIAVPPTPSLLQALPTEQLWRQYEQITLSQQALDADMLSRLWTAFQSPFRPSAGITASTVTLDIDEVFAPAPLVATVDITARPAVDADATLAIDTVTVS
ncbi:Pvc16 family protein [Sphingomonas nostoxanthinifaciens]|uniref:Pvc16 family protein n=1 Tax=Sphingomonas nostoxanthinifaciens TaxID=2872652 RepID=UPI001CC1EE05|nr:Pvc16 family protein [Sphingomonas nostoxanthinifaciens]UAK23297.1 DUF4255 domain-containing protein [Sphingomonas nostoxanthinifaciens]